MTFRAIGPLLCGAAIVLATTVGSFAEKVEQKPTKPGAVIPSYSHIKVLAPASIYVPYSNKKSLRTRAKKKSDQARSITRRPVVYGVRPVALGSGEIGFATAT